MTTTQLPELLTEPLASVKPEKTEMLVPGFPRGEASLVAGPAGAGKSIWLTDFCADASTGRSGLAPPGTVLIVSPEENAGATLRPRLDRAGADLDKVLLVKGVRQGGRVGPLEVRAHFDAIRREADRWPDLVAIAQDPVNATLGRGVNNRDEDDVRGALQPLVDLAHDRRIALVWISHLRKSQANDASSPLDRITGSGAFGRMPRVAWLIDREHDGSDVRVMAPAKYSIGKFPPSRRFTIEGPEDEPGVLRWLDGASDITAEDLVDRDGRRAARVGRAKQAEAFLRRALAMGPRLTSDVEREAAEAGIGDRALRDARVALGVKSGKVPGAKASPWMMRLAEGAA